MNLRGTPAMLALWNSVSDAARVPEYEAWHAFEHVPERVGTPGFMWGWRYAAVPGASGQPAYFTLYGLDSLAALQGPRYQELLDHPTDWSARMRGVLGDFRREPCELLAVWGQGSGAQLATLALRIASGAALARLSQRIEALVSAGAALGAVLGRVDARSGHPLSGTPTAQAEDSGTGFDAVLLLHHLHQAALHTALQALLPALGSEATLRHPVALYALQSQVARDDLTHPLQRRQPARPELRQGFPPGDTTA